MTKKNKPWAPAGHHLRPHSPCRRRSGGRGSAAGGRIWFV